MPSLRIAKSLGEVKRLPMYMVTSGVTAPLGSANCDTEPSLCTAPVKIPLGSTAKPLLPESVTTTLMAPPAAIFKTRDGYITVGSLSDAEWRGLCGVIARPEWIEDARFRTPAARSFNAAERLALVGEILASGFSQDWLDRLDAAEVPCAPVLRRGEVMDNVQVIANELIETFEQPDVGIVRQPRPAARFDRTPARIGGPAPRIGEHTPRPNTPGYESRPQPQRD